MFAEVPYTYVKCPYCSKGILAYSRKMFSLITLIFSSFGCILSNCYILNYFISVQEFLAFIKPIYIKRMFSKLN